MFDFYEKTLQGNTAFVKHAKHTLKAQGRKFVVFMLT